MKLLLLALALLMAFVAVAMAQAASPAVAVSGEMPGRVPTKADIEQLVGHPISDEDWNKTVSLDPSPAVLLGSNNPNSNNADSSPASTLHPFVFVFLLFVFVPIFDF